MFCGRVDNSEITDVGGSFPLCSLGAIPEGSYFLMNTNRDYKNNAMILEPYREVEIYKVDIKYDFDDFYMEFEKNPNSSEDNSKFDYSFMISEDEETSSVEEDFDIKKGIPYIL